LTEPRQRIPVLIDLNVADDVVDVIRQRGHRVTFARDELLPTAPDEEIAKLADDLGAVVLTWDKDFSRLISRTFFGSPPPHRHAGRISFVGCRYEIGRRRLERYIELIELEWALAQRRRDRRLIVTIRPHQCVIEG
jgi:hypothetical protein